MKTILYQPLFINPQAYFVFPQLYHIEKGDSYIEPANITGQLIINNLSEGLTLTPTVNVIQDSNQVDFSLFKGKHIRISQYTNIGAVVLGEWYIPGTPEPEQPDWFKESIVAWYSPYCKQGMTNFDVIESYAEDFTRLNYYEHRGTIDRTPNKIVITESKTDILNIIENINTSTNDIVIKVTGVSEELKLFVQDINSVRQYISKDGVYKFTNNVYQFFGFGINKVISGINVVIEQLPTSILKDFSGNKHDAYLYGFKGKLNSGVGIYAQDFKNWSYGSTINNDISTKSYNKFHIVKKKADNWFGFTISIPKNNYYNQSYKLKFNINKKIDDIKFSIVSTDGNLITTAVYSVYINDGSIIDVPIISEEIFNNKEETNIYYDFGTNKDIEIDVELIANYPNQLCYDGKSYAVAYGLPILTDYTVIADRTWFAEKVNNGVFMSKALKQNGAFILEYKQGDKWNTYSYYSATNINIDKDNSIVYQTKNKYNEQTIYPGDKQDTDTLFIGTIRKDDSRSFIGCHSDILLFNRTLTEYEISWVKNNLMCSKPQEPDEGEYTEGSIKLTNRRIMGINNPTTTSIFQDLMQVLETGFTIGKIALYNKELNKDEFDSEAFHKGFAVRHSTFEKDATTHLFRDGHKELTPGEYLLPFETLYLRVDVPEGYTMQDYVFDGVEQSWKPNTPKAYTCPEYDFHIIAMGEQVKVIKNWSPLTSISTFGFRATDNQIEFAGSTDGGTMSYILDDTDVTKFTIEYTNTAGEGNVYLMIGDKQYDVISGQLQTYSVSGSVKLEFLNMEEINNFAGTIKFTNVN